MFPSLRFKNPLNCLSFGIHALPKIMFHPSSVHVQYINTTDGIPFAFCYFCQFTFHFRMSFHALHNPRLSWIYHPFVALSFSLRFSHVMCFNFTTCPSRDVSHVSNIFKMKTNSIEKRQELKTKNSAPRHLFVKVAIKNLISPWCHWLACGYQLSRARSWQLFVGCMVKVLRARDKLCAWRLERGSSTQRALRRTEGKIEHCCFYYTVRQSETLCVYIPRLVLARRAVQVWNRHTWWHNAERAKAAVRRKKQAWLRRTTVGVRTVLRGRFA